MSAISGTPTRHLYDSTDSLLRFAMRVDATVTGLCGLVIAFVADPLSSLTGLSSGTEYGLGALFVFYGLVVFSLAAMSNLRSAGTWVVTANGVFTLGAIVAAETLPLTAIGVAAALVTAIYHRDVRGFAIPGSAPSGDCVTPPRCGAPPLHPPRSAAPPRAMSGQDPKACAGVTG